MDLRTLVARAEAARRQGIAAVEMIAEQRSGQRWSAQRGKVEREAWPDQDDVTVRVWTEDGRRGECTGPVADLDAAVAGARAASGEAAADPFGGPVPRQVGMLGGLGILDRRFEGITDADREEVLVTAERAVKGVDRRLSPQAFRYEEARRVRQFVNSRGVALEEADTTYRAFGSASTSSGGPEIAVESTIVSRTFSTIASIPFGTTLAMRLAELLRPKSDLAGPVRVVLPPLAVARLVGALAERFSYADLEQGSLFLRPRPDGRASVDPRLHLQDDAAMPGGLRSWSFDDRGVAPVAMTLLREGRVDGRFVDPETARRHDLRPTGHTRGGMQRPSNLILRSGTRSMSAVLADLGGQAVVIDDLPDLSALDFATGHMDVPVHGVLYAGNRPEAAVRRRRLVGDLGTVLNRVVEVCSDTDRIGHVDAPALVVDGFTLT